jgi:NADPH-dependent ferric siderophore reductase
MAEQTVSRIGQRVRHELRRRVLTVRRVTRITPKMLRVTLAGAELEGFTSPSFDDHAKIFFPAPGQNEPMMPEMGPNGPIRAEGVTYAVARDYTPRRYDAVAGELDIDFALHEFGAAMDWIASAAPGQKLGVGGPRGSFILPDDLDWYLLVGDEAALPAISRRLEELPPTAQVIALVEVADASERQPLPSRRGISLTWLERNGAPPGEPDRLAAALEAVTLPAGAGHAWVACESDVARRLRRILLEQHGLPKERVKAAAYWRRGATDAHETLDD